MNNPSNVHAFFAKLATAARGNSDVQPSLTMLHRKQPASVAHVAARSLEDVVTAALTKPVFVATELHDFGVGLPPLARC
ncbi:MAG: hypothetical protein EKK48_11705 [Candidatus Melainabacteria bacterium]|nr:MAG: hypothetical protein EKK48_11705 [Candidatus Melainabacteria bacterium]